ncbi:hypothetical protein FRC02_007562 [Tulasnella sp. 418]|nr:hypothetical protein FRC02_007562 [Tulasnella sp. 418]
MSALQLLKFSYRTDRLDFTSDWIATEEEFGIDNVTSQALAQELMAAGKFDELEELLATSAAA